MTKKIQYFINPQDTIGHYYQVKLIMDADQDSLELVMPSWTPGSYMIRDYARLVHGFKANCPWEQTGLSNWTIFPGKKLDVSDNSQIEIEYKIYAYEDLSVRTNHLEEDFGLINSPGLFFYIKEWMNDGKQSTEEKVSISIEFEIGKPFSFIHSSMERVSEFQFITKSWDELFDTPFFLNHKKALEFECNGITHELVIEGNIYQNFQEQLLKDLKSITEYESKMMGENPNEYYLFVLILSDGKYGGLEHASSSINIFDQAKVNSEKDYSKLLELLSHEYFHLWNVKRIRPIALGPFDYENPNLTKELWIAEGITSFYDAYFLLKTKLMSSEQYLEKIYEDILNLEDNLGDEIMSLEESSFTAWNKLYKRTSDSPNTSISYYTKGAVLVFCMNLRILEKSRGEKDFSGIMRA
ncbi:MAG: M61 family metallopeptidase, partial [Leptospira sp.]|nr:M61 family metallopeptidase [Leptospira sp.]